MTRGYFARAGRGSADDIAQRVPELAPLRASTICIFGLGCLGAPSTLEFARCGAKELRIVDPDIVDPATICRWPLGIEYAGKVKVLALMQFINRNYPYTKVTGANFAIGAVRKPDAEGPSSQSFMKDITADCSLIYDATAEVGVQQYLSDLALELNIPYIGVEGTAGGWGGKVLRVLPASDAGCWMCYRRSFWDAPEREPPMDPAGNIQPRGCGDPTFTGAGFDMTQIALAGVRCAVSTLCASSEGGYPAQGWDVMTIALRLASGELCAPDYRTYNIERHPQCNRCCQKM